MQLNKNQDQAINDMVQFLNNDSDKFFNLSGPAGVGKTQIKQYLISEI